MQIATTHGTKKKTKTFTLLLLRLCLNPIRSQSWGYLWRPCLWEGISLVYLKFCFEISRRIFLVTGAGSHMSAFGQRVIILPRQQQTRWRHSTWCDSPTWLCNFLKQVTSHREAVIKRNTDTDIGAANKWNEEVYWEILRKYELCKQSLTVSVRVPVTGVGCVEAGATFLHDCAVYCKTPAYKRPQTNATSSYEVR